jgi:hypothetical protein
MPAIRMDKATPLGGDARDDSRILCRIVPRPGLLHCGAVRSRVHGGDQLPQRPDRILVKPHLATADEMDHRGDDL